MKTCETAYGRNEVGKPARNPDGGGWERIDTYTSKEPGSKPVQERRFCAGPDDYSPVALTYNGNAEYSAECSCCWLGFSHTLDLHNREKGQQ